MKALRWDPHTDRTKCYQLGGERLHYKSTIAPNATRLVKNWGCNFTFYDPHIGNVQPKTKANKLSERLANNAKIIGSYKGRSVKIHQVIDMPVDDICKSMKAHEDIIPFNDP